MLLNIKRGAILCLPVLICLFSCQKKVDPAVEYIEVNGQTIPKINVELIEKVKPALFTEWFEDFQFVVLESTEGSLISRIMRTYVGENYIIISTGNRGVLQFDRDGKFIKAIAAHGGGPGEVTDSNRNIFVDEEHDKVYIEDSRRHRDKVLVVKISTGEFEYIPFMNTGTEYSMRDVIVKDDSLMYITPMPVMRAKSDNPLYCQTTSGELKWELKMTHPAGLTNAGIRLVDGEIYFNYVFAQDTIYKVEGSKLVPVALAFADKPRSYFDPVVGSMYVGMSPITKNWYRGYFAHVTGVNTDQYGRERKTYDERQNFLFNIKTGEAFLTGTFFTNDYLGFSEKFYLQIGHNRMGSASYQAVDLVEFADSVVQLPDTPPEIKVRLEEILERVDIEDNPCILIGKLKNKI